MKMSFITFSRLLGIFLFSLTHLLQAQETFAITQIADDSLVNREPVISETGLIAWHSHGEGLPGDSGGSDIFVYQQGELFSITRQRLSSFSANMRPQVHSNRVVWQTTRDQFDTSISTQTWVIAEVPDDKRDVPYQELPAYFRSQLPSGVNNANANIHLEPTRQLHSGPYSNYYQWTESRIPQFYTLLTNATEITNNTPFDPRDLAAKVATEYTEPTNKVDRPLSRRGATGLNEIYQWSRIDGVQFVTHDGRNDLGPAFFDQLIAWQKAKAFPFGWEIMVWDNDTRYQLTTNFYYDMAPKVHRRNVTWYGWDGNDYEIFLWNADTKITTQITSNQYDDVSPQIMNGKITWMAYPTPYSEIYYWDGDKTRQLSNNIDDDLDPVMWGDYVAWHGYDGFDYEIYLFDGQKSIKITDNDYDDIQPDVRDGLLVWMGYVDNYDAEIFYLPLNNMGSSGIQLTDNDYEDRDGKTADGKIVWQADKVGSSGIYLATPSE